MDALQALTSGDDPLQRARFLDDILKSLNRDEKRKIKRLLNDDPALITTYRSLPIEIICNIVDFLDVDDIFALYRLHVDSWHDTWFSPTACNIIVESHFRVLAFHENYVSLPEADRKQWLFEELRQSQARKDGVFETRMLEYLEPCIFKFPGLKDRYGDYSHGRMVEYNCGIEVANLQTKEFTFYQDPNRTTPLNWGINSEYLVTMYRRPTKLVAWRLDGTTTPTEYSMHCPLSNKPMAFRGHRVAFPGPLNTQLYVWHIGSRLQTIVVPVITTKESGLCSTHMTMIFHPEDDDIIYIFCIVDGPEPRISVLRCTGDHDPVHIVTGVLNRLDGISDDRQLTWPARLIDFSGTYILYFTTRCERVTFNVYTETLGIQRTPMQLSQVRSHQVWENMPLEDEMIRSLIIKRFGHSKAVSSERDDDFAGSVSIALA